MSLHTWSIPQEKYRGEKTTGQLGSALGPSWWNFASQWGKPPPVECDPVELSLPPAAIQGGGGGCISEAKLVASIAKMNKILVTIVCVCVTHVWQEMNNKSGRECCTLGEGQEDIKNTAFL